MDEHLLLPSDNRSPADTSLSPLRADRTTRVHDLGHFAPRANRTARAHALDHFAPRILWEHPTALHLSATKGNKCNYNTNGRGKNTSYI
jgi:hypothetical protein